MGDHARPRDHILELRWSALLNEFRRSGLTHAEFCHRRGSSIPSFPKPLYQVPTPKPIPPNHLSSDAALHFLPVTLLPDPSPATAASRHPLELLLNTGRRSAVAPGFDPQTLRQLIALVEEGPCSD